MTDRGSTEESSTGESSTRESRRRRQLAEIFGDVLPETTSDELHEDTGSIESDRWYRENRPPHHE